MTVSIDGTLGVTSPQVVITNGTSTVTLLPPASGTLTGVPLFQSTSGAITLTNSTGGSLILQPAVGSTTPLTLAFPSTAGSNGQVLTSNGTGGSTWSAGGGGLTVGTSPISGGVTGSILTETAGVLTELLMGTGVSALIAAAAGGPNGFAKLDSSGQLPAAQGGTAGGSGAVNVGTAGQTGQLAMYNAGTANTVSLQSGVNTVPWVLTLPTSGGTNGYFLQTNGSGVTTWAAVPSGGLTINSTLISGGSAGAILTNDGTKLQEIVMGTGVSSALTNNANAANGLAVLNGSGAIAVAQGGTGLSSLGTAGQVLTINPGATAAIWATPTSAIAIGTTTVSGGTSGDLLYRNAGVVGGLTLGSNVATALGVAANASGGIYTVGSPLGTPTTLNLSNATSLPLTTGVTGVLPIANGGTNLSTIGSTGTTLVSNGTAYAAGYPAQATNVSGGAANQLMYQSAGNTTAFVTAGTTGQVLSATTGSAPTWGTNATTIGTTSCALGATNLTLAGLTTVTVTQDPTAALELTTKQYVDAITAPLNRISPVVAATTANITLSGNQTIDTVSVTAGMRVLVKDQTTASQNGVYDVGTPWTRTTDANTFADLVAGLVYVTGGSANDNTSWIQTTPAPGTIDVTAIDWAIQSAPFVPVAGAGIGILANTISNTGVLSLSAGTTGLSVSSSTGAVTLSGTLAIANGGTGATTAQNAIAALLPAQSGNSGKVLSTDGTNPGVLSWVAAGASSPGGANTEVQYNNGGAFGGSSAFTYNGAGVLTLGAASATTGSVKLFSSAGANSVTVTSGTNSASWTLTLPTSGGTNGQVLTTNGSGVATWTTPSSSGTVNSGTSSQLSYYAATGTAVSGNANVTVSAGTLTLGVASTTAGELALSGSTSGTVTVNTAATAGTWTLTLPINTGSNGQVLTTNGSGVTSWTAPAASTATGGTFGVGTAGSTTGTLSLFNSSSSFGVGIQSANNAAAWTLTLPVGPGTNGQFLQTNGSGVTSWATVAGSGTVNSGTANQLSFYSATGTAVSGNSNATISSGALTLGVAGTAAGSVVLSGSTSGTVTVNTAAAAGAWTLTLPTTGGTNGQVLATNGSGVTSWVSAGGSGTVTSVGQTFTGGLISVAGSPVTSSGTLALTVAGTSGGIPYFSSATTWASSAALAANGVVIGGGAGVAPSTIATANGGILNTSSAGVPSITSTPTLGVQGTTAGTLILANTNAGAFPTTVRSSNSATAAWTMTLPVSAGTSGQVLQTDGAGVTSWASASTPLTAGSVAFGNGTGITQDNANFFWDDTANQLSIGTNTTVTSPTNIQLQVSKDAYINGMTVGRGLGQIATNTAVGSSALAANTTGANNSAVGRSALAANTTGANNSAVGSNALAVNTTGATNTAVGSSALAANTTGANNVAVGASALAANVTGVRNIAVGASALTANTGDNNTAVGHSSLQSNSTGVNNTGLGLFTLLANTTGFQNTAVGGSALSSNTTGINNTSVGWFSLRANATGTQNIAVGGAALQTNTFGSDNIGVGFQALSLNTTGAKNIAIGTNALAANVSGTYNTAVGYAALDACTGSFNVAVGGDALGINTTGAGNVAVGTAAAGAMQTGTNNTAVGTNALNVNSSSSNNAAFGAGSLILSTGAGGNNTGMGAGALGAVTSGSNNAALGYNSGNDGLVSLTTQSDYVVLGNNTTTTIYGKVAPSNPSDIRDKNIAGAVPHGLEFVNKIEPIEYTFKTSREDDTPHGRVHYGFSAQNLLALEGDKAVIIDESNPEKLALNGSSLIPVLVNAIKELSAKVAELEAKVK
jgi:hypothetical protein